MKQNKQKKQDNRAQGSSPYIPSTPYAGFAGDPRLSRMAMNPAKEKTERFSGRVFRALSLACTVVIIVFVLALPLALLYEHIMSKDSPQPDNSLITGPAPEEPTQPQTPPTTKPKPTPTPEPLGSTGLLSFDLQGFVKEYESKHGSLAMEYQLYINTDANERRGNQSNEFITNCLHTMRPHFYHGERSVSFGSSKISTVLEVFLIDGFEALRIQKGVDEYPTRQECLDVVQAVANRICAIAYVNENKANFTDDQFEQIIGCYSIGQWGNYADNRLDAYDVYWTEPKKRSEINNMHGLIADSLSQGLMLYLYGYTPNRYTADGGGTEFLSMLNKGLDKSAMLNEQVELTSYIRNHLPRFTELPQETEDSMRYSVGLVPYKYYQSLIEMMPDIVEQVVGMDYAEFLSSGAFVNAPYDGGVLRARYTPYAQHTVWGVPRLINRNDLNALLATVTFTPGNVTLTKQAELGYYHELFSFGMRDIQMMEIRHYSLPVVSAGFDALGNYYLQSSNYYAKITPTQYDLFIKICTEGEKDNNQYAYERLELYKSIKR